MFRPGDIVSHAKMCVEEGFMLQRGMNYQTRGGTTVILMSVRPGAPYPDRFEDKGRTLIYIGHNISRHRGGPNPEDVDQPMTTPGGRLTQNGLFYEAAKDHKRGVRKPERIRVYEKVKSGIWVYNGVFELMDAAIVSDGSRKVFEFKLRLAKKQADKTARREPDSLAHTRMIPTEVKRRVWQRDKGKCAVCGSTKNLHFDHIIPFSKGGSSLVAENIQLLCARHNIAKRDRIE